MAGRDTKAHILDAATAVFAKKGFARTSMNDIMLASGLSKGGVYWHFKSKDDLIYAIFDHFFQGQLKQLDAVLAEKGSPSAQLIQLARLLGQESEAWVSQFPFPMEFYALAARDGDLKKRMAQYFRLYAERLVSVVKQGIAEGEFRAVDPAETVITLEALLEGILLLWAIDPTQFNFSRQVERSVRLLMEGLHDHG